jgi:hypothetical protein
MLLSDISGILPGAWLPFAGGARSHKARSHKSAQSEAAVYSITRWLGSSFFFSVAGTLIMSWSPQEAMHSRKPLSTSPC